ncbi:hypothetical protein A1Q2_00126 [Trichosporon asahii var. asahii CBS 8904]|uniref:Uncharacterized protein n=2 Tax=Trichosporon asahii var. asahii TaxID=189963 RepID=K1WY36_TRIAC|nr:hypothetical protein A1Q1_07139 [Trichosporon asahii var. asahii CBS 2479]EJT51727.1 hypothetical protein A1Q1_07139 [Trichosporon asahii var. asahii CBS 2479]EKD05574.1 hypothetical protein A1Q2_00126 [Trichosporon asahii var. asahii CBS 8904]
MLAVAAAGPKLPSGTDFCLRIAYGLLSLHMPATAPHGSATASQYSTYIQYTKRLSIPRDHDMAARPIGLSAALVTKNSLGQFPVPPGLSSLRSAPKHYGPWGVCLLVPVLEQGTLMLTGATEALQRSASSADPSPP